MRTALVLRHAPHIALGSVGQYLREADVAVRYVDLFRHTPDDLPLAEASGLVILGGAMNVDDVDRFPFLALETRWIAQAVDAGVPVLGICLGGQLLAKALGAAVRPNPTKEIGWYQLRTLPAAADDPLFAGCLPLETVFHWHGDTFDLPAGAVHLAETAGCRNQAFRYGDSAWGLQFHIEITASMIDEWMARRDNRHELATLEYLSPASILERTNARMAQMAPFARRLLSRFAALVAARQSG